jgi:hypothetical protein
MTPSQFNESLPAATDSKFYNKTSSTKAISAGECKVLVEGRKYTAQPGYTVDGDVKNAAVGVDEWVKADGGNAYALSNFEWITIGDAVGTQLIVYFDTMSCR